MQSNAVKCLFACQKITKFKQDYIKMYQKYFNTLKKAGILCIDQKFPANPMCLENATTVTRKQLILKN
jgi:hypothetical protein